MLKKKKWLAFGGVVMATLLIVSIFAAAFPKKKACKHVFDEGTVAIAATCQEEGKLVSKCEKCGEKFVSVIPKTEHDWVNISTLPDCSDGVVEVELECECGFITYYDADADLKHHDYDHDRFCDICGLNKLNPNHYSLLSLEYDETIDSIPIFFNSWYKFEKSFDLRFSHFFLTTGEILDCQNFSYSVTEYSAFFDEVEVYWKGECLDQSTLQLKDLIFYYIDGFIYLYLPLVVSVYRDGELFGYVVLDYINTYNSRADLLLFDEGYEW